MAAGTPLAVVLSLTVKCRGSSGWFWHPVHQVANNQNCYPLVFIRGEAFGFSVFLLHFYFLFPLSFLIGGEAFLTRWIRICSITSESDEENIFSRLKTIKYMLVYKFKYHLLWVISFLNHGRNHLLLHKYRKKKICMYISIIYLKW